MRTRIHTFVLICIVLVPLIAACIPFGSSQKTGSQSYDGDIIFIDPFSTDQENNSLIMLDIETKEKNSLGIPSNYFDFFLSPDKEQIGGIIPDGAMTIGSVNAFSIKSGFSNTCGYRALGGMFDPSQDQASKLLINEVVRIIRYDIGKCEEESELLNLNTVFRKNKNTSSIAGFTFTEDLGVVWFGKKEGLASPSPGATGIYQYDLKENKLSYIAEGLYPMLSPNGLYLAYFSNKGLHVYDLRNEEKIVHVDMENSNDIYFPHPYWNTDGSEILFHFLPDTEKWKEFYGLKMYIYHLESGELQLIDEPGLNPKFLP